MQDLIVAKKGDSEMGKYTREMLRLGVKSRWLVAFAGVVLAGQVELRAAEQKGASEQKATTAPAEATTCEGRGWQKVNVNTSKGFKTSETEVPLTLVSTKDGKSLLTWPNADGKQVEVDFHKTKAPVTPQGDIEICSQSLVVSWSGAAYSLPHSPQELLEKLDLQPGYYAIRGKVGCTSPGCHYDFSNFVMMQLP